MAQMTSEHADGAGIVRSAGAAGRWELDAGASTIEFGVKNFWGLLTVKGRFADASGDVAVSPDGTIGARLDITAASVDTGQAKRDAHLRSKDFFDVERFPTMGVEIDRVDLAGPDRGTAHGRITVLGVTKPVDFAVRIGPARGGRAVVEAELTIDRSAFGMAWRPMRMAAYDVRLHVRLAYRKVGA